MSSVLTGIVPIVTKPMDFNMDWHDCLMPVAPDFYAIEQAVLECAYAGCHSIWIVANDDVTPLVRHRIGDYVEDPVYLRRPGKFPSLKRQQRPVFYVPIDSKHKNKEWSIAFSILYGAKTAFGITSELSKWVAARKFYVSFPYSVYPADAIRPHRQEIARKENFLFKFCNRSALTGDLLGFTFTSEQMEKGMEIFKEIESSVIFGEDLKNEKEYFFDNFSLDKIFNRVILLDKMEVELPWFYQIDSWDGYCDYLSSEERKQIKHPGKLVISYREFNPIGIDNDNNQ